MLIKLPILALVSASLLAACAAQDDTDATSTDAASVNTPAAPAVLTAVIASGTPTMACNLEYENLVPFQISPVASFVLPFSQVQAQGAVVSDGHYQLAVSVNPTPSTNLSFNVQISNVQTAKDTAYSVLPPPQILAGFLFETGARISALTKAGVTFDHIRAYCSYKLAP